MQPYIKCILQVVYSRHYATIDKYFFDWQHRQVNLFGTPFIVPSTPDPDCSQSATIQERIRIYLVKMYGFDDDFIDNLMFNINIKKVKQGGRDCCLCPWKELCYGHKLMDDPGCFFVYMLMLCSFSSVTYQSLPYFGN